MESLAGIATGIGQATGRTFEPAGQAGTGGGCINQSFRLEGKDGRRFFVKLNDAEREDMFAAEAAGLEAIEASKTIRVPSPITYGRDRRHAWLVLEWLDLGTRVDRGVGAELGQRLAAMHRSTRPDFGWDRDNTIGATPQPNPPTRDWTTFFRVHRLGHQLALAHRNHASRRLLELGERLAADLDTFFSAHDPVPSLLHGDLWGGNYGIADGMPVLFDPAVYFGDREADLAMTELFGGFPADFHAAYREAWPLDAGYATRKHLYNLYHVLNHFNLFGGGYGSQAEHMMERLLSEIR